MPVGSICRLALSGLAYQGKGPNTSQIVINAGISVVLVFLFQPLRRFFERITNRLFYRYQYDSEVVLSAFTKVLVSELDLERLPTTGAVLIASPLPIVGGSGSPCRVLAFVER